MPDQTIPGTTRLLRISSFLPVISVLLLSLTGSWHELTLPDSYIALLVVSAVLPALASVMLFAGQRSRSWHVPLAMGIYLLGQTTLTSLLHNLGVVRFDLVGVGPLYFVEPGVLLMIPALLIAWQYGWRGALFASGLVGGLHLAIGLLCRWLAADWVALAPVTPLLRPDLLFILPLLLAYLASLTRRQHTRQQAAQTQLREYAATVEVMAASRERRRIATWLQETLAGSLAVLGDQLESLGIALGTAPESVADRVSQVQTQARNDFQKTLNAIANLRGRSVEELGLIDAIKARTASLSQQGIEVVLQCCANTDCLTGDQELLVYHVADEALRIAEAQPDVHCVELNLACIHGHLALTVHNDGTTYRHQEDPAYDYLEGLADRLQLIGGHLCVDSQETTGTTLALWLPCRAESQ